MRAKYGYQIGAALMVLALVLSITNHANDYDSWIPDVLAWLGVACIFYRDGYKKGRFEVED